MRKIIASIDMGSNSLKLVVGEFLRNKLNILAVAEESSIGIQFGKVINKEEVVVALKKVFAKAEDMIGLPIKKVVASIPSQNATLEISEGKTTITNEDRCVKSIDIVRAMQAASYNKIKQDDELACIIPIGFKIDEERVLLNPINENAEKLEVKTLLITVPKKNVHSLIDCIEKIGVEVIDIAPTSLGDYACFQNSSLKNDIGAIINIGQDTTTVSVFNKGIILNTAVIELGGRNLDNDIAYVYKLTLSDARHVKEKLGLAHNRLANPENKMEVTNKQGEIIKVDQYEVSSIINSRLEEILKLVKKQINLLTKKEIHYIMITGGVTEMSDFALLIEEIFGHHAKIASVAELGARDNKYSASVGLMKYYENKLQLRKKEFSIFSLEEQEELSGYGRKVNFSEDSILGKLFGYFFDN
ncbi:MAG: cell division protein FtsA [Bacilli bacterium]|jgi:cell division protein FtsA|nr:cell division protein FtsA [Bacilli bacterium]